MKFLKILLLPFIVLLSICMGCNKKHTKKPTDWSKNLEKLNNNPFSLQLANTALTMLFPKAKIEYLKPSERLNNLGATTRQNKAASLILVVVSNLYFNDGEIDSLVALAQAGNQVMLVANNFDENLLDRFQLSQISDAHDEDSLQKINIVNEDKQSQSYSYKYKIEGVQQAFQNEDTAKDYVSVLGTNQNAKPNFIIFRSGKGRFMLHTVPMTFCNYFLVQGKNRDYLKTVFSYIDEPISNIYFVAMNSREVHNSDWSVIWRNLATKTALLLALFTLLIYIVFEMKRRQRIIPIIKPVENSSVAFTETIGRLYYNNKNHTNLAEKMSQHFLEFVRSNYYINTNILDAEFVRLLSAKSGKDIATTDSLIYNIKMVHDGLPVDEAFLFALYTQIQAFYNGK
jgi:hypothetical protein